jgi:ribosomal protein S18 acetylase RimI-like enzyme
MRKPGSPKEVSVTEMNAPLRQLVLNEARAYAVFTGGRVRDHGFAVSLACEQLPDARFNRSYLLQSEVLTPESLQELMNDLSSVPLPFRMDVFLPVSKATEELLKRTPFDVTESFASEMVLAKPSDSPERNPAVRIERLSRDDVDTFSTVLMNSYEMPPDVFPVALPILHQTISEALDHQGVNLYLAYSGSEPVGVLYLFAEEGVGGIYNVGVLPEGRKQGVARALMLQAIEDWRAGGHSTLCLQCRAESFQERFYQQLGFEVVARRNRAIRSDSSSSRPF